MSSERGGGGGLGAGFVLLIFVGLVVKFWLWILAGIAAVAACVLVFYLVHRSDKRRAAELEYVAAIAVRADQQHAWTLAGDDRGTYGDYRRQIYPTR
jgi:ABC-type Fe3+-siderophore transport system permease subunit